MNCNTTCIVPIHWREKLILVDGGIRGSLIGVLYGRPYMYENFPWSITDCTYSEEDCSNYAQLVNSKINPMYSTKLIKQLELLIPTND